MVRAAGRLSAAWCLLYVEWFQLHVMSSVGCAHASTKSMYGARPAVLSVNDSSSSSRSTCTYASVAEHSGKQIDGAVASPPAHTHGTSALGGTRCEMQREARRASWRSLLRSTVSRCDGGRAVRCAAMRVS